MALAKNRQAVQELIKELEPLILGREREGFSCGCGAIHCGTAVAEAIITAGDSYPGQETMWYLWSVQMKTHGEGSDWSCGLSFFVESNELEAMFNRYFGDQKKEEQSYKIEVDGADRVYEGLPAAVRIDDPFVNYEDNFKVYRDKLGAEIIVKNKQGHFAGEQGVTEIPFLLELLK